MRIAQFFNSDITIKRATSSVDSGGSPISTYSTIETIKCCVQPVSGFEPVLGGRKYTQPAHKVYCDKDTDILMTDIIIYNSEDYQVAEKTIFNNAYLKIVIESTN